MGFPDNRSSLKSPCFPMDAILYFFFYSWCFVQWKRRFWGGGMELTTNVIQRQNCVLLRGVTACCQLSVLSMLAAVMGSHCKQECWCQTAWNTHIKQWLGKSNVFVSLTAQPAELGKPWNWPSEINKNKQSPSESYWWYCSDLGSPIKKWFWVVVDFLTISTCPAVLLSAQYMYQG